MISDLCFYLSPYTTTTTTSEKKIRVRCRSITNEDPRQQEGCSSSAVATMSEKVEGELFRTRESLESYADLASLDARLQALALITFNRRLVAKKKEASIQNKRQRTEQLVQVLGGIGRFRQIQTLLQEIRDEQQNFVTTRILGGGGGGGGCVGCCCGSGSGSSGSTLSVSSTPGVVLDIEDGNVVEATSPSPVVCPLPSNNNSNNQGISFVSPFSGSTTMPDVIKDLYFGSQQLRNAFEMTPIERLHQVDWKSLIAQNQALLRTFREWNGELVL